MLQIVFKHTLLSLVTTDFTQEVLCCFVNSRRTEKMKSMYYSSKARQNSIALGHSQQQKLLLLSVYYGCIHEDLVNTTEVVLCLSTVICSFAVAVILRKRNAVRIHLGATFNLARAIPRMCILWQEKRCSSPVHEKVT